MHRTTAAIQIPFWGMRGEKATKRRDIALFMA